MCTLKVNFCYSFFYSFAFWAFSTDIWSRTFINIYKENIKIKMKFIFEILFFIFKLLQWIVFRFIIILSQDLFIQYSPDCIYIKVVTFKKSNYSVLLEARLHFSEFFSNMSNVKTTGIHYSKTNGLNYNTHDTPRIHVVLKTNRILLNLVSSIYLCILLC